MTPGPTAAVPASGADVLIRLRACGNPDNIAGMRRFGITPRTELLGVGMKPLRELAKSIRKSCGPDGRTVLARELWTSGVHEARVLATLIFEPSAVPRDELDRMAADLDSWDVCDQFCSNLCRWSAHARDLALDWSASPEEFVRRAGFSLMACLAVGRIAAPDDIYLPFLERIEAAADDSRNFVAKAVNWALRQIGKRNDQLHPLALAAAGRILEQGQAKGIRIAGWIARDALRELRDPKIVARIKPGRN